MDSGLVFKDEDYMKACAYVGVREDGCSLYCKRFSGCKKNIACKNCTFAPSISAVTIEKLRSYRDSLNIESEEKSGMEKGIYSSYSNRPSKDEYYSNIAKVVLTRSTCMRRKYGAVLVKNDEIISTGYNGAPRGELNCIDMNTCRRDELGIAKGERYELCRALHAEDNAITSAGRERALGATLYIAGVEAGTSRIASPMPCIMCRRKIKNAGIKRVVGVFEDGLKEIDIDSYE